jgi:hypothetical protein
MAVEDFHSPDIVFRMGYPPIQVDILTSISGVSFDEAWPSRVIQEVDGISVPVIGRHEQIKNKRAAGRPKDQLDADWLESH